MTDVYTDDDVEDAIDLSKHRTARETAAKTAKVKEGLNEAADSISSALDSVMSDKFVAFVQLAEMILPQHSVLKEAWFNANVTSLVGVYIDHVPPEKVKEFFLTMIDWMYEARCASPGGLPKYPPVLCTSCAEHAKHEPQP